MPTGRSSAPPARGATDVLLRAQQPAVTAPIVGVGKPAHLHDALASLDLVLDQSEIEALSAPYTPRSPEGF